MLGVVFFVVVFFTRSIEIVFLGIFPEADLFLSFFFFGGGQWVETWMKHFDIRRY